MSSQATQVVTNAAANVTDKTNSARQRILFVIFIGGSILTAVGFLISHFTSLNNGQTGHTFVEEPIKKLLVQILTPISIALLAVIFYLNTQRNTAYFSKDTCFYLFIITFASLGISYMSLMLSLYQVKA